MEKSIYITESDMKKLESAIQAHRENRRLEDHIVSLEKELDIAHIIPAREMPDFIVTMNSRVLVHNLDLKENLEITIVYPESADITKNRISILAPVGVALIGQKIGDVVEISSGGNSLRYRIDKILYQPEKEGRYDE